MGLPSSDWSSGGGGVRGVFPLSMCNRLPRVYVPQLNLLLLTLPSRTFWHCWWLWGLLPSFLSPS